MDNFTHFLRYRKSKSQLLRYALVGTISNAIGYLFYLSLTHLGCTPIFTMSLVYSAGATIGFFGNRSLTFSYKGSTIGSGVRFIIAHIMGYLINLSIIVVFVQHLGYPHQGVQAVAIFFVATFLFIIFKFFVFRASSAKLFREKK